MQMDWDRIYVTIWYALIAFVVILDLYTIIDRRSMTPTLTQVIVRDVPWWITMPFLGWMFLHFLFRYAGWGEWF